MTASLVVTCVESECVKELQVESGAAIPLLVSKDFLADPFSERYFYTDLLFTYQVLPYMMMAATEI